MARTQLIFVGGRPEAAWESLVKFKDSETKKIIGIYSDMSRGAWEEIKKRLGKDLEVEGHKVDMNNMAEVALRTKQLLSKNKDAIINITGVPKETFLALIITALNDGISNPDIVMLQTGAKEIRFSPQLIKYAICDINGKTKKFLREIYELLKDREEMSLSELKEKMGRTKATLSDSLKRMADRKIIIKRREGNKVFVRLNPFARSLLEIILEEG